MDGTHAHSEVQREGLEVHQLLYRNCHKAKSLKGGVIQIQQQITRAAELKMKKLGLWASMVLRGTKMPGDSGRKNTFDTIYRNFRYDIQHLLTPLNECWRSNYLTNALLFYMQCDAPWLARPVSFFFKYPVSYKLATGIAVLQLYLCAVIFADFYLFAADY